MIANDAAAALDKGEEGRPHRVGHLRLRRPDGGHRRGVPPRCGGRTAKALPMLLPTTIKGAAAVGAARAATLQGLMAELIEVVEEKTAAKHAAKMAERVGSSGKGPQGHARGAGRRGGGGRGRGADAAAATAAAERARRRRRRC